jgi:hypothetical protein
MLSATCETFEAEVEALDPEDYAVRLGGLTRKLARDAAEGIENYACGEIPALLQLCARVLAWLQAEAEEPDDQSRRYERQRVVLDLLTLCHGIAAFHSGSAAQQRKPASVAALRDLVADALRALVEAETCALRCC